MSLSTHAGISNEDIMSSIFMKLPVKFVLKCRCVCKTWESIASNPYFCRQHASLQGLNPSPSGYINKYTYSIKITSNFKFISLTTREHSWNIIPKIVSFDYLNAPCNAHLSLLSSCNGLMLFQSSNSSQLREYYVCNPTTKKSLKLELPNYLSAFNFVDANLDFDPCVSPYYKVVFLWKGSDDRYCTTMYFSETKSCGKVSFLSHSNYWQMLEASRGGYCNGKILLGPNVCPWFETLSCI